VNQVKNYSLHSVKHFSTTVATLIKEKEMSTDILGNGGMLLKAM
jgi:hypothetical protein